MEMKKLKTSMNYSVFKGFHFNEKMKGVVRHRNYNEKSKMKKKPLLAPILSFAFVALFLVVTAQFVFPALTGEKNGSSTDSTLDTSHLKVVEQEERLPGIHEEYAAPSLEVALQAIPFKLILPQDLTFDHNPFQVESIQDLEGDGKTVRITLQASAKNTDGLQAFTVQAANQHMELHEGEEVAIAEDVVGSFGGTQLVFESKGVFYLLDYLSDQPLSTEEAKEILVKSAKQMLK
ncbi:hypothetical protein [Rossellomorea marisflavi]|uniref:hypothetical protein n=1 Tax=Rossellomorea marisflavi TaxID=189381 RepID=UPI0011E8006D|nr:hypothetical protein [Rossellomorea marisflavi]TYO68600.1 hypothetical protein DQ398_003766 [Rossellomorea marisflavi]